MATSATLFADAPEDPWWWGDAPPVAYDAHPPTGSDVVVVGGGYAGLSCATELALAGRLVTVLDIRYRRGCIGAQCRTRLGPGRNLQDDRSRVYVGPDRAARSSTRPTRPMFISSNSSTLTHPARSRTAAVSSPPVRRRPSASSRRSTRSTATAARVPG